MSDVVEIDGVDIFVEYFMLEVELFDVSDALFVVGNNLDVAFGPGVFIGFGGEKHGNESSL